LTWINAPRRVEAHFVHFRSGRDGYVYQVPDWEQSHRPRPGWGSPGRIGNGGGNTAVHHGAREHL